MPRINIFHLDVGGFHAGDPVIALCGANDTTLDNSVIPEINDGGCELCIDCTNHPNFALYELASTDLE